MFLDWCYTAFINLDHRKDRLVLMQQELDRHFIEAERFPALKTSEHQWDWNKVKTMMLRTPGAVGCHYSQVEVMRTAWRKNRHAFILEDDTVICKDFHTRMDYMDEFLAGKHWDIIWLGGTFHVNPPVWHRPINPQIRGSRVGRDVECTEDPRIVRTYGAFSTHAYIVNVDSIAKILHLLDEYVHESIGIDWIMIKIQPQLHCYAFVPGCVKQRDNQSDIGNGMTNFSGFSKLGPYWYQDRMEDFDPTTFNWGEAKNIDK